MSSEIVTVTAIIAMWRPRDRLLRLAVQVEWRSRKNPCENFGEMAVDINRPVQEVHLNPAWSVQRIQTPEYWNMPPRVQDYLITLDGFLTDVFMPVHRRCV